MKRTHDSYLFNDFTLHIRISMNWLEAGKNRLKSNESQRFADNNWDDKRTVEWNEKRDR